MKKLLSMLLAVAMVVTLALTALPAMAEETALDISISSTDIKATNVYSETVTDGYIDEETQEVISSPEYTRYLWYHTCTVDVTINGDTYTKIPLTEVCDLAAVLSGNAGLFSEIRDDQSYENQWEVGETYTGTYFIRDMTNNWETVWSVDLAITLCEPSVDIELSDIVVDEMYKEGGEYLWEYVGTMTATIDGTEYTDVYYCNLEKLLEEKYGAVELSRSSSSGIEEGDPFDQNENPWEVGHEAKCLLTIRDKVTGECLYWNDMVIRVCETKIESVSIAPISYYAYQGYARPEITAHYKDGTSAINNALTYSFDGGWPDEVGSYTVNITVADTFVIPVQVTVLENPTSGKLGENITWAYDETTETLTLSGTGATSSEYESDFMEPFSELEPKYIVIEEGIEYLFTGIFHNGMNVESISLPTTLKEIPDALVGWNGPSEDSPAMQGKYNYKGMSSIVIPEGITSLTNSSFYYCWGISDYYLPATLKEIDLDTLCYVAWMREEVGASALQTTIHFAGTEEQWAQVEHVTGSRAYGTGLTDAELEELFATFTVVFEPQEEVTVENGTATIPDSTVEITEGEDVVIDLTETEETVESVVLDAATVEKIAEAESAVEIALPEATVRFDAAAIAAISNADEGETVTIVVSAVEESSLTDAQQKALAEENVCAVLKLETYAGEKLVSNFKGGVVTVSVPFEAAGGKTYTVVYIADDGTMTLMPTTYAGGFLTFTTTHFSDYVVLESASVNPPVTDNPQTGDNGIMLFVLLMVVSAVALVVCTAKRKAY